MIQFNTEITADHQIRGEALLLKLLRAQKPGRYRHELYCLNKRSLNQNAYVHVVFTLAQKGLYDAGYENIQTMETAKQWYKERFLQIETVNKQTGELYKYTRHTSELSKDEMANFIDLVREFSLEYTGVYIPTPEEYQQGINKYDLVALAK